MDSLKVTIAPEDWGNLVTKYAPHAKKVKTGDFTAGSKNWDTDVNGFITKRKGGPNYNSIALSGPTKDQYEAIFSDGARHLLVVTGGTFKYSSGDTIFNTVQNGSGFTATTNFEFVTTQNRVYGGNTSANIVYDRSTSYGGVGYTAPRIKTMGAQAPGSAPVAGAPTAGGAVPAGAHTYKVTFLYYDAEESNGSAASAAQTAGAGNFTIPLSSIPIGGYGVTARKVYRDDNDGNYVHLHTISDNTTTTYNDALLAGVTPTPIPTDNEVPPAFGQCVTWLSKVWIAQIAGDPFTLRHSEAGLPDIFPSEFEVLCNEEDPITALVVYFGRLVVFNRKSFGQILGNTSDTFKYDEIPSSVGCIDNRTLQIRVVNGVPILIWLSDRGFYSYDGNSVNYISDFIEDLVNFNIQQVLQQKNSISQSSFSGTAEDGIDSTLLSSLITTRGYLNGTSTPGNNPRRIWDDQGDWTEVGSARLNTITGVDNLLKQPTKFQANSLTGALSGNVSITSGALNTITTADFTGQDNLSAVEQVFAHGNIDFFAQPIQVPRAGIVGAVSVIFKNNVGLPRPVRVFVYRDGGGIPGTLAFTGTENTLSPGETRTVTESVSLSATANETLWIVAEADFGGNLSSLTCAPRLSLSTAFSGQVLGLNGTWVPVVTAFGGSTQLQSMAASFTFIATALTSSGSWLSASYDSQSTNLTSGLAVEVYSGAVGAAGSGLLTNTLQIEASDDNFTFPFVQSQVLSAGLNPISCTLTGHRYFRFRILMVSTDNRYSSAVYIDATALPKLTLRFTANAVWESAVIDCTAQVTVYNSLTTISTVPSGTVLTTEIATSTVNTGPWTYVPFGSHVVRQFVRIRHTLATDTDNALTASVTSTDFKWTVVAKYTSTIIDTAINPPAGWDLFLADYTTNGGTVLFEMRAATTSGGIPAATFFTVIPNDFPSAVTPNQFVQWRVTLTSSDEDVPQVDAVTVQWFISIADSIRPASIFIDGRYYCALAELDETTNNILIEFDLNGKWRLHEDLNISTFSFFFNRSYAGMADSGYVRKFLGSDTDNGAAIELDVRTKAFDFSTPYQDSSEHIKIVERAVLQVTNTGASYKVYYSVDNGVTFYPMYLDSGSDTLTTTSDGMTTYRTFKPIWVSGVPYAGRTIMYRFWSNDINQVEIQSFKARALKRLQEPE